MSIKDLKGQMHHLTHKSPKVHGNSMALSTTLQALHSLKEGAVVNFQSLANQLTDLAARIKPFTQAHTG